MKKIFGYLIILALLAGSICGITYGIKYAILSNQTDPEYTQELEGKVSDYQEQMNTYYLTILDLQSQINELKLQGTTDSATISSLENTIASLNSTIDDLNTINELYEDTIEENEITIAELKAEIITLQADNADKSNEITTLENRISSLEAQNETLQATNTSNLNLITSLNQQIITLNEQISTLSSQITDNTDTVTKLNAEIAKLQQTISYYETYIANLENDEQAVVTFMYNGSVYNIQVVTKGTTASITNPTSTDYIVFNGWTINDEIITLDSYTISTNTVFTASLTYNYDVTFVSNSVTVDSQIITLGSYATTPTAPTLEGYEFDGWTINGVDLVDVDSYEITGTTTFIAKFTVLHTVTFMYENNEISTQSIRDSEYATAPSVEDTDYKTFNGWTVDSEIIDVTTYSIIADTVFTADITYSYDVLFVSNGVTVDSQIVTSGSYATSPTAPTLEGYEFDGWTVNGVDLVDVDSYEITYTTTFTAVYTALYTVTFMNNSEEYDSQVVLANSFAEEVEDPSKEDYGFMGWSIDKENVIDIETYSVTQDTTLYAVYSPVLEWTIGTVYTDMFSTEVAYYTFASYTGSDTEIIIPEGYSLSREGYYVEGTDVIVEGLGYALFYKNTTITSVVIPDTIKYFVQGAMLNPYTYTFANCTALQSVTLSNNLTTIGPFAFAYCTSLTSIIIPDGVTSIGSYAFRGCTSLTSIIIPDGVTGISSYLFDGCSNLIEITFGENIKYIGYHAFSSINSSAVFNMSSSTWYTRSSSSACTCDKIESSYFNGSTVSSTGYVFFREDFLSLGYEFDDGCKLYSGEGIYYYDATEDALSWIFCEYSWTFELDEENNQIICTSSSSSTTLTFDIETREFV